MIIYGTKIESDRALPLELFNDSVVRYEIQLSSIIPGELKQAVTCGVPFYQTHGRTIILSSDREFAGSEPAQPWCYEVENIVRFYWVGGRRIIYYELDEKGDANLLSFWFVQFFLPFYYTLENMYDFLHAGAVEIDGAPVLFIAPSMGGKSTMTDYFIKQGHTLVSDDKVATFLDGGKFMVTGSHPYYRPYRKAEELGARAGNFAKSFKPIHAFYALEASGADSDITVEEVKGFKKFGIMLPAYLYMFPFLMQKQIAYLSTMLNSIRVFNVKVPWNLALLGRVYDVICKQSREVQ